MMKNHTKRLHLTSALLLAFSLPASATDSEVLFERHCASCHSGHFLPGAPGLQDATLTGIASTIRNGLPMDSMPAFGAALSEGEIASLAQFVQTRQAGTPVGPEGRRVDATTLNPDLSANYRITPGESDPDLRYLGHIDGGSLICYDDLDMTGVNSIEFHYARVEQPGRFAMTLVDPGNPGRRINLGETTLPPTDGWEEFSTARVGLSQSVTGRHTFCFMGLDGGGIFNLTHFTLSPEPGENDGITWTPTVIADRFFAGGYDFVLEPVGETLLEFWAMAFLPDGTIVANQKNGSILLFRDGEQLGPVEGTPAVWNRSQGGLLAVLPHPDYAENGWLYLTFSDMAEDNTTMTRVVRGQLDGLRWVNQQTIYQAPAEFYSEYFAHFGSRMAFDDGYIYFSVGDRGQGGRAQALDNPFGKIHRLYDDGRVPEDNPFVGKEGALASIWSYGHRNPQGMTRHPHTGDIWSAEHGPMGGDEVNLIRKGLNYGWPLVSHGTHYDGTIVSESPYLEGTEPPIHHWTPSIAVSQITFYTGDRFPQWRNHLLAASLGQQELRLLRMDGNRVIGEETLLSNQGRIRDVVQGPDGYPYVVLSRPQGAIYRLVPVE